MSVTRTDAPVGTPSSVLISQLARGMRRRFEEAVASLGVRPRELHALQYLRERGPSAQQTLTELLGIDATNIVAVLNSLEDAGLIERRRDPSDRRRAIIALSPEGGQRLADLDRALCRIDDELLGTLTGAQRATLNDLLARAVGELTASCSKPSDDGC
ncbi:MAG TPA: MarR family winged helix-turn-helix transcriptional regulator [Solirubrobacteraceae bacterium]|nr:MarR family winged helix-turn-helix transcriptional regulator [Solirubrobacteraceae bacterium]